MRVERFSLKDQLFNQAKVAKIASEIESVHSDFHAKSFVEECIAPFPKLELKQRIHHIALTLKRHLPEDFLQAVQILLDALPPPCDPKLKDNDFGDFIYAPYGEFVALFGCNSAHVSQSLDALTHFTTRFSMEYALRPFINAFPEQTLERVHSWCEHEHYHVRRLASEGTRPKLPWGIKISTHPETFLPILERLHSDETRFVTRSVANHLNDLSKINPSLVIERLESWRTLSKQREVEMHFITNHALRSLIKNGDQSALQLIGFHADPKLKVSFIHFLDKVIAGTALEFDVAIQAHENCKVLIDFLIYYQSSRGELSRVKVFKLKQLDLIANKQVVLSKKHLMRGDMTTRKLYPGLHRFVLQVNGKELLTRDFELIM